jgi:hypothetical protein
VSVFRVPEFVDHGGWVGSTDALGDRQRSSQDRRRGLALPKVAEAADPVLPTVSGLVTIADRGCVSARVRKDVQQRVRSGSSDGPFEALALRARLPSGAMTRI